MDEETLRKEFEEWEMDNPNVSLALLENSSRARSIRAFQACLEFSRRSEMRAMERCADICEKMKAANGFECAEEIRDVIDDMELRATIPEPPE